MKYTLEYCREMQEKAKLEGKMVDVSWWSGYMAALIDNFVWIKREEHPPQAYEETKAPKQ